MTQTTSREEIAANVRAAMGRGRVAVGEVADVIGKSQSSTSERINGHTHFRIDELQAIAAYLGVSLEQLLAAAEPTEAAVS